MFLIWHIIFQFNYILQAIYYQVFDLKKFIQKAKNEQKAKMRRPMVAPTMFKISMRFIRFIDSLLFSKA